MSHNLSEHMSQKPSRNPSQQELTIRSTPASGQSSAQPSRASPPTQQRQTQGRNSTQPSQPSPLSQQRPYPSYPIPIPSEKFERGLILLARVRLEEGLAQREPKHSLNIPSSSGRPASVSSHASSGSYTPSTRNGGTVVSFDDNGSPSSAAANPSGELVSFDGKKVKTRKREPLKPVPRARAALIRHLGSCWVCRSRRVSCPLEHHDISALDRELAIRARQPQSQPGRDRSVTAPERPRPTIVNTDNAGRRQSDRLPNTFMNDMDIALTGIGHSSTNLASPSFELTPIDNTLPIRGDDIFLDPLLDIQARSQYTSYQDGQMFLLGVLRDFFFACQHLGGTCQQLCSTINELETHFEEAHFAYTRITPSHRWHCLLCERLHGSANGVCVCGYTGAMEVRIYGNFIRLPTYDRYAPDGQDFFTEHGNQFTAPLYISDSNPDIGRGMGNHGGFDMFGGMNQGGFYQNNNNSHHAPGPDPRNNFGFDNQQPGGFQYQGSQFGDTSDIDEPISVDISNQKVPGTSRWQKPVFIIAAVLFAASFAIQTHGWFIAKGNVIDLQPCLPFIGFTSLFASFVISQKFLATKHPGRQFGENLKRSILQSPLDKLSSSSAIPFKYRPAARKIHIRGRIYL